MHFHRGIGFIALLLVSCTRPAFQEQGWASYIADQYAGRMTSSGQPYNPYAYTAAHTSLPFGTELKVKNLYTKRSVKVIVTDRYPAYPGRVVNLSGAAAREIGMGQMQLAQVQVTARKLPPTQAYAPQQAYQPQAYAPQQAYASQQAYQQPAYSTQSYAAQPRYAPQTYGAPTQPAQPRTYQPKPTYTPQAPVSSGYQAPTPRVGGAPNAPAFNGTPVPPAGLKTF